MKKYSALLLLITIFFSSSLTFGQDKKSSSTNEPVGTTWVIYSDLMYGGRCGKNGKPKWDKFYTITFLPNGKVKGDTNGHWNLVGNQLTVEGITNIIMEMKVTVRGNIMTGTALLGMSNVAEWCVRVVHQK